MKDLIVCVLVFLFCFTAVSCKTLTAPVPEPDGPSGARAQTLPSGPRQNAPLPGEALLFDAGTIWNGTFLSHVFVIENTGSEPYEIRDVSEGEGVRIARFSRTIPAHGKGEAVFEVATGRLKGPVRRSALVHFRAPRRPPLELVLTAEVRTSVEVGPVNRIQFKNDRGKPLTWHFRVTSPRKPDFTVRNIETHTPHLKSELRLLESAGAGALGHAYDLTITLDPGTPIGTLRELVRIRTDIPDGYPGEIFITGAVEGPIMTRPERVIFKVREGGSYSPLRVSLSNRRDAPFKVTDVKTDAPQIEWSIIPPQGDARAQVVELRWSGTAVEKLKYGRLILVTDVADQPGIEVPYAVFPRIECEEKK